MYTFGKHFTWLFTKFIYKFIKTKFFRHFSPSKDTFWYLLGLYYIHILEIKHYIQKEKQETVT